MMENKDYLYYMIQRGHENKRIFLHLYPSETDMEFANEYGFVNNDFAFSENELKLPIWEPKKVSRISLDKEYSIFRIATGQFDEFGREWETDFELSDYINMPEKIIPDSLTDSNWTNGIKNDGTVILMKAENELVFHLLEGKSLKAESGKVVYVKQVVQQGEWMHIILNEPLDVSDGYPHAFQVLTGR